jgi:hypothetical protein
MSNHFRRTWQQHCVGHVLFTVQVDPLDGDMSVERHRRLAELTRRMIDLFSANRIRATWATGNPANSAIAAAVIRSDVDHELAILGSSGWVGPTVGRTQFAKELARRVGQAGSAGINITSLVPRVASIHAHVDLVLKQGISAVAGLRQAGRPRMPRTIPRALHYGLWELPVTSRLPLPKSWLSGGGGSLLRQIRAAASEAATYHLVIDAAAIEQESARGEAVVAKVIRGVAELRNRGLVRVDTLTTAAARLADVPTLLPQRSILRVAA